MPKIIPRRRRAMRVARTAARIPKNSLNAVQKQEISSLITRRLHRNVEDKYVDTNIGTAVSVTSTPTITLLNGVAQGSNVSNRLGNQITITRLELKSITVVGDATQFMRLCLIWDKQPNGALAAEADIWALAGQPLSQRNNDKIARFDILWDHRFILDTNDSVKMVDRNMRVNRKTYFNATAGAIANITTGALLLFQLSDSGAAPNPTQGVTVRVFYEDA